MPASASGTPGRILALLVHAGSAAAALAAEQSAARPAAAKKPHVLFILADDYGWANFGAHRRDPSAQGPHSQQALAEVHTPNMDRLIREGTLLDRHYSYRICSPSRSSLMSGRLAVHVNTENAGVITHNASDPVSGYAGIPRNMTGMARKLKDAGYSTHMVGKWDVGMATPEHSPTGKGFDSFLGYFQHANDYWQKGMGFQATGEVDECMNKFVDFLKCNKTFVGGVTDEIAKENKCMMSSVHRQNHRLSPKQGVNATGCTNASYCISDACYEEAQLKEHALSLLAAHDPSSPLFLFYSFHLLHTPLQIPESYLHKIDRVVEEKGGKPFDSQNRRYLAAMVLYMDDVIGELEKALRAKGMWDDTLIVFTSDNGGPVYEPGSANNHPLKGGKYSDWEGGVRTNAFVSGGFLPEGRRGSVFPGVISIADWYGTLCELAGVSQEDTAAEEANVHLAKAGLPQLPPVDSVPQWTHIVEGTNGRPEALHLSTQAVLIWPYKLVTGTQVYSAWQGELYPNCSTVTNVGRDGPAFVDLKVFNRKLTTSSDPATVRRTTQEQDCGAGCLFNVERDPTEHEDLASDPAHADMLRHLQEELARLNKSVFNPKRGAPDLNACYKAMDIGGFYGPFVGADGFYTPQELSPEQQAENARSRRDLAFVEKIVPFADRAFDWLNDSIPTFASSLWFKTLDRCI